MPADSRDNQPGQHSGKVLWHPTVHKRFGEDLYYFRFAAQTFSPKFNNRIERLLSKVGVTGYDLYTIFGEFDLFLRVWLTRPRCDLLESKLKELQRDGVLANVNTFSVQEVVVFQHNSGQAIKTPGQTEVASLSQAIVEKAQQGILAKMEMDQLLTSGLLVTDRRGIQDDQYKFFMVVDYPTNKSLSEVDISDGLRNFLLNEKRISRLSAFGGRGFARYLIKGVARDFYQILEFDIDLLTAFALLRLQTNTIVVAERFPKESDSITFGAGRAVLDQDEIRRVVPELEAATNLSLPELHEVEIKIFKYRDVIEADKDNIIRNCIIYISKKNEEGLANFALRILTSFESMLRDNFSLFTVSLFPEKDAGRVIAEAKKHVKIEGRHGALGQWVNAYQYVMDLAPDYKGSALDWSILKSISEWRNKLAHQDTGILEVWSELVDDFCGFVPEKQKLIGIIQQQVSAMEKKAN